MSNALKAALLSALIFPGVGHFSLKKPVQGSLLVGIAGVCLCFLMTAAMAVVQQLSAKIHIGLAGCNKDHPAQVVTKVIN